MREPLPDIAFCAEKARLRENFLESVQQLTALHEMQAKAVIAGDSDFSRFDLLIHMANEHKAAAKYALLAHIESHGCKEG